MWKWITFLLHLLGLYRQDILQPQEQEAANARARQEARVREVDDETEQHKADVDTIPDADLDDELDRVCGRAEAHNRGLLHKGRK